MSRRGGLRNVHLVIRLNASHPGIGRHPRASVIQAFESKSIDDVVVHAHGLASIIARDARCDDPWILARSESHDERSLDALRRRCSGSAGFEFVWRLERSECAGGLL